MCASRRFTRAGDHRRTARRSPPRHQHQAVGRRLLPAARLEFVIDGRALWEQLTAMWMISFCSAKGGSAGASACDAFCFTALTESFALQTTQMMSGRRTPSPSRNCFRGTDHLRQRRSSWDGSSTRSAAPLSFRPTESSASMRCCAPFPVRGGLAEKRIYINWLESCEA